MEEYRSEIRMSEGRRNKVFEIGDGEVYSIPLKC
jgi:hypothetical protein